MIKEKFPGTFLIDNKLATLNLVKGFNPFNEELIKIKNEEYRLWDPNRSKLAAAILKGIKGVHIKKNDKILYLGIAHGMTASHIANIIRENGIIYGVEFSDRCFQELLPISEKIKNIIPILADARLMKYKWIEEIDVVYFDIAQSDQTEIAIRNCKKFLKPKGYLLLAIKARSIDVTKPPKQVCKKEIKKLEENGFEIIDWKMLEPFEDAHAMVVAKMK